ncbi:MAG: LysM peptidoglycan-binding domain-containing protein [Actinomycetota bacterium]|nr:LysM peptidoglycan-binding domain-containing protein [Actinomycetota bacterium]
MAAVAHASPADYRRMVVVRTDPFALPAPVPARIPVTAVYRRRRIAALLLVISLAAALVLAFGGLLASFGGGPLTASERPGAPSAVYVVQPGDTFWGVASRLRPGEDPRPLVAQLVAAHGSPVLVAGERLRLPAPA